MRPYLNSSRVCALIIIFVCCILFMTLCLQIWSSGSDTASGASDVTMKPRQSWMSGDTLRTILSDAKGEVRGGVYDVL